MATKWSNRAISLGPFTGLRARVVLFIAGLTVLLFILFGFVVMRIVEHNLLRQKKVQGRIVLTAMQTGFDLMYMPVDRGRTVGEGGMLNLVRAAAANLEIDSLVVVDKEQNVIGHNRQEMVGMVLAEAELARAIEERKLIYRVVLTNSKFTEMVFFGPLYRQGTVAGAARYTLSLDEVERTLSATRKMLGWYAVFDAVVIILLGSLVMLRLLVQPVENMVQATERMAAGDYRVKVPGRAGGEIGRLGRALGKLASTLQDKQAVMQRQLKRLERINEELKTAHDQLLHSDRLAYVGRVAAGVAHEVGNPLGVIYGYVEILKGADLADEDRDVLVRLEKEIQRIDQTMRGLLDFSRIEPASPEPADLMKLAREATEMMKTQRGLDRVQVVWEEAEDIPPVVVNPAQFKQVIVNLLLNAADAMAGEGEIRFCMDKAPYDKAELLEAKLPGAPDETQVAFTDALHRGIVLSERIGPPEGTLIVRLHVIDSGPGMSAEVLKDVFEPFFTTKPQGKGTGLGLAICQRIVSSAGGLIRIESRPGAGTCISLIYPAAGEEVIDG